MSWILFLIVLATLVALVRKSFDTETKSNMVMLAKIIGGLLIVIALLAVLTSTHN
jgi:hypothetical protein